MRSSFLAAPGKLDWSVAAPTPEQAFGFEQFWDRYPRKLNRRNTLALWTSNRLGDQLPVILQGLERYRSSKAVLDNCAMDPANWLSGERGTDHDVQPATQPARVTQTTNQVTQRHVPSAEETQAYLQQIQEGERHRNERDKREDERWQQAVDVLNAMTNDERAELEIRAKAAIAANKTHDAMFRQANDDACERQTRLACIQILVDEICKTSQAAEGRHASSERVLRVVGGRR